MRCQITTRDLFARGHQAITWVIVDFSLARFSGAESNFKSGAQGTMPYDEFENYTFKVIVTSHGGKSVNIVGLCVLVALRMCINNMTCLNSIYRLIKMRVFNQGKAC